MAKKTKPPRKPSPRSPKAKTSKRGPGALKKAAPGRHAGIDGPGDASKESMRYDARLDGAAEALRKAALAGATPRFAQPPTRPCTCKHVHGEHEPEGRCEAEDCRCLFFEENLEAKPARPRC